MHLCKCLLTSSEAPGVLRETMEIDSCILCASILHPVDNQDEPLCLQVGGPAAAVHLKDGETCFFVLPVSEFHSLLASTYHCSVAFSISVSVLGALPREAPGSLRGNGARGRTPGTFSGLTNCLTTGLLASPLSRSLDGQWGHNPAFSMLQSGAASLAIPHFAYRNGCPSVYSLSI